MKALLRKPLLTLSLVLALLAALLSGASRAAQGPQDERVAAVRAALEKRVETERLISAERRDWALGQEMLASRTALVEAEIAELRTKLEGARQSIAEADVKRGELTAEHERQRAEAALLTQHLLALEARTRELLPRLPDPIRTRVAPLSQRIPAAGADSRLGLGERFQNVVGVLNEVNKFEREVTLASEVHTLPDGSAVEVAALYLGLGQGWFASGDERVAALGTASASAWVWSPADAAAPAIARAIAILQNEEVAAFVALPLEIR
jgi:hypothetical protein